MSDLPAHVPQATWDDVQPPPEQVADESYEHWCEVLVSTASRRGEYLCTTVSGWLCDSTDESVTLIDYRLLRGPGGVQPEREAVKTAMRELMDEMVPDRHSPDDEITFIDPESE